jgi:hypothetical protein
MSRLLPLLLVIAIPVTARADDLKDILDRNKIAIQKLNGDVNNALALAKAWERADPARAKKILEGALAKVKDSTELPDDQRASLRQRLQTRITEVSRLTAAQEQRDAEAAKREADKLKRDRLGNSPGSGTSDTAKKYIANTKDQIAAADRLRDQKAKGNLGVFAALEASATPIDGVVEYPKYWRELTYNRDKIVGNRLTEKEITLLKALNSTLSVDFKESQFKDVLEYIQEKTGLSIIVDEGSLKDAMVEYNDPVTFKVKKVTVRTILKKILADRGLGYILKEGTVQVLTAQRARETLVQRSYPIDDLVGGGNLAYGPFVNRAIMLNNVNGLIQTIQNAIDPTLWNTNGGPGSITFFEPGRALIIRAPAEMHYMFGAGGLFK